MTTKKKTKLEEKIKCPMCGERLIIKQYEETITPSVKAEKKTWIQVEKDTQQTLDQNKKTK